MWVINTTLFRVLVNIINEKFYAKGAHYHFFNQKVRKNPSNVFSFSPSRITTYHLILSLPS